MNAFRFLALRLFALLVLLVVFSGASTFASDKGMGLDPNGRPAGAAAGDRGAGLDPNG